MVLLLLAAPAVSASPPYDDVRVEYPAQNYLIGVGETEKSDRVGLDKRIAEVLARAEIARQIKVRLKEETVDIACEGPTGKVIGGHRECMNMFLMVIEQSVDEVLVGTRIVRSGERNGIVYAVAILPRAKAADELETEIERLVKESRERIKKAKKGDADALDKVRKDYLKALALEREKEVVVGEEATESRYSDLLEELEKELSEMGRSND
jgi:hypothetical protein